MLHTHRKVCHLPRIPGVEFEESPPIQHSFPKFSDQIGIWKMLKLGTADRRKTLAWHPRSAALSAQNTILLKAVYFYGTLLLILRYKIISLRLAHIIRALDSWQNCLQSVPVAPCQGQSPHRSKNRSSCRNLLSSQESHVQGEFNTLAFRKFRCSPQTDLPLVGY